MVGGHRVERIDDRQHARRQRQVVALAILRLAVAVEPGAAVVNDFNERLRAAAAGEHFDREGRVARHQRDFFRLQPARLQQHFIGHADFADVVQQRGDFQQVPAEGRLLRLRRQDGQDALAPRLQALRRLVADVGRKPKLIYQSYMAFVNCPENELRARPAS